MRRFPLLISLVILGVALLLAGCDGDDEDNNADTLPEAQTLLNAAASVIQNAQSFGVEIDIDGYPVAIGTGNLELPEGTVLSMRYAKGVFQAPDRMQANVEIALDDFGTTAELIAIGNDHYLRGDLITIGRWLSAELIPGFSPASLQSEDGGIAHALDSVSELAMQGQRNLDGIDVYQLRGKVQASELNAVTFGLIRSTSGELEIDIYIQTGSRKVERIVFDEPPPPGTESDENTTWNITILDYDREVSIEAPVVGEND
jgi:hypothetical protein